MGPTLTTTIKTTVIFLCFFSTFAKFKTFHQSYHTFNKSLEDIANSELKFENHAKVSQDALQVTPDTGNNNAVFDLRNRSGRIMFRRKFKLWDGDMNSNSAIASFNTSFLVNLFPQNGTPGEGLAFLIAPAINIPDNSYGEYLGLTNATTDNQTNNGVVAVELDTLKQTFDIDDNHIGLNIHSIRSVVSKSLTPQNITLVPDASTPAFHNLWIQYNGVQKIIRIYIADQPEKTSPTPPMPKIPIIEYNLDLRKTVNQNSYLGFAASTGEQTELNCVLQWNITVEYLPGPKSPLIPILLGVGIPLVLLSLALIVYVGYRLHKKRMAEKSDILKHLGNNLPGMPKEYQFRVLKKATNNFDEKRKLGQGGYGVVYRGVLPDDNVEVAVKLFSRERLKGETDFLAELMIINRLRHRHLVRLLGWCHKNGKLLLVYEYMQKGSLDMRLFTISDDPLTWTLRRKILAGVASALHYIHYEYDQQVVHRDIKASNIMLDNDFNARLGDFGLARALDNEKTSYADEAVLGTVGYIAPECFHTGKATPHSDIYAFGALLIEVVSGQRNGTKVNGFQLMVDYVWSLYREGRILDAVDKRIADDYDTKEAERFLLLGLACSHPIASERPRTHTIGQILSGSAEVPRVPPFKPAFVWPAMMPIDDLSQATSIDTTSFSISRDETEWTPMSGENNSGYTDRSMV